MFWPMIAVVLSFCGLAALAVPAVRVYVEVRRLARQVSDSSERISRATEDFQRASEPLAAALGETTRDE